SLAPRQSRSILFPYTTLFRSFRSSEGWTFRTEKRETKRSEKTWRRLWRDKRPTAATSRLCETFQESCSRFEGHGPLSVFWEAWLDRKSTRLNSSHEWISYAVF